MVNTTWSENQKKKEKWSTDCVVWEKCLKRQKLNRNPQWQSHTQPRLQPVEDSVAFWNCFSGKIHFFPRWYHTRKRQREGVSKKYDEIPNWISAKRLWIIIERWSCSFFQFKYVNTLDSTFVYPLFIQSGKLEQVPSSRWLNLGKKRKKKNERRYLKTDKIYGIR